MKAQPRGPGNGPERRVCALESLEPRQLLTATPTTVNITPDNANVDLSTPIALTGRFADADGHADLRLAEFRVADGFSNTPRCFARYDFGTDQLKLYDDGSGSFLTAGNPGGGTIVSNAQCTLNATASSTTLVDANTVDVTISVSFTSQLQGTTNLWLRAFDESGTWSTADDRGDITIGTPPAPAVPATVSLVPSSSTVALNTPILLTGRFSDDNGRADLRLADFRVSDGYSNSPRCFVRYDQNADTLKLYDDASGQFLDAGSPGLGASVSNSACTLDAAASSTSIVDANTLDVSIDLSFTSEIEGERNVWLKSYDQGGLASTSDDRGDITIGSGAPQLAPVTIGVTPDANSVLFGEVVTLTGRFSDDNGFADIQLTDMRISDGFTSVPRCFVRYDQSSNELKLYDDAIQAFISVGSPGTGTSANNADCTLDAANSSVTAVDATTLDVSLSLSFGASMEGAQNIWLTAYDQGGLHSTDDDLGNIQIGDPNPVTVSLTPASSAVEFDQPITLTGTFSDFEGYADIRLAELRVATGFSNAPRCLVRYDQNSDTLKLYDDTTGSFLDAGSPGSGSPVSNLECTLFPAGSSISAVDAETLEVAVSLSFTAVMDGDKNVWLKAYDQAGLSSTSDDRGDIDIGTSPAPTAPTTVSVTPSNVSVGLGAPTTFTGRFADANGHQDLRLADVRIADSFSAAPRCLVRYDVNTDSLKLYDDALETFLEAGSPGNGSIVSNAECSLDAAASSTSIVDENTLDVSYNVSFTSVMTGDKHIWLKAYDDVGLASSNDDRGDIGIDTAPPPAPPQTVSITPSGATIVVGDSVTLTGSFSDINGHEDLRLAEFRVSSSGYTNFPRCFVRYDYNTNLLKLYDDATSSFVTVGTPGSNGVVTNADCTLDAANSSVTTVDATTSAITIDLAFTSTLEGQNNLWMRAMDHASTWSSPDDQGDLTILQATTPSAVSVTPNAGSVLSSTPFNLAGRFSDVNGYDDLGLLEFQISNDNPSVPRCYVQYDQNANELKLYDDGIGSFVSAGAPGSSNSVSNLHCTLDAAPSTVVVIDSETLDVTVNLSLATSMHGVRNIWLEAIDDGNLQSGATDLGDVTVLDDPSAPTPPADVVVVPGDSVVSLDWRDNQAANIQGYNVFRSSTSGGPYTQLNTSLLTLSRYEDTTAANNVTYHYVITSVDDTAKESVSSAEVSATPGSGPWQPTTVSASPVEGQVDLQTPILIRGRHADGDGWADITLTEWRIADAPGNLPRCYIRYDAVSNELMLFDETSSTFANAGAPGTGTSISNEYCSLDAAASSTAVVDSLSLDLNLAVSFEAIMESDLHLWFRTYDDTSWSNWQDHGDLQVGEALASIVNIYTDHQSYDQNSTQLVYVNAAEAVTGARIDLYDVEANVVDSVYFDAAPQTSPNADPAVDGFGYTASFSYEIGNLPSGLYFWGNLHPFVVKDTPKTSEIRVVFPSNTLNAYECEGGRSLYAKCSGPVADSVHFDRMFETIPMILPGTSDVIRRDTGGWGSPYFWWLEQEIANLGSSYGALADIDLDDPTALDGADILVLPGHNEYWTRTARENVDAFVAGGGHLVVLSGNTMWWQSRYENDSLVVYKSISEDPVQDPLLKTINWNHATLQYPIVNSIGLDFAHGGYLETNPPNGAPASFNGYKVVAETSPLLQGTGLVEGEIIEWDDVIVFTEYDGPPVSGTDANGYPIIDNSVLGFHQVELIAFDHAYRLTPGYGALIAFQPTTTSGMVVNSGTMLWGYETVKSPDAARLQTINYNILDKLLNDESIFSPPPPPPPAGEPDSSSMLGREHDGSVPTQGDPAFYVTENAMAAAVTYQPGNAGRTITDKVDPFRSADVRMGPLQPGQVENRGQKDNTNPCPLAGLGCGGCGAACGGGGGCGGGALMKADDLGRAEIELYQLGIELDLELADELSRTSVEATLS